MSKAELSFKQGPLSVNLRQHSDNLTATLHATGRKLEVSIGDFPSTPDRDEPFNTLDFEIEGTRLELFLSDMQLENLAGALANAVALLRAEGSR